mmetsp:Transcript_27208/g.45510  ORF Transcript_27208/g.45510 Transcript_27208/m.45510 type:complete len:221 (-) Transcript_27208:1018-1680(-)
MKGSSTIMLYLPAAHCLPLPKRPAYGRTESPASQRSATAANLAKKVASSAPTECPLSELKPVAWKACEEAMHSWWCPFTPMCAPSSAPLRSGPALLPPAASPTSSASTSARAASGSGWRISLSGGMIGGQTCCRWNRIISVMANEFIVPLVGSLISLALAQHLTSRMRPVKRTSMVLMWRRAWLLNTPVLFTHMSKCTPVWTSTNLIRGTLAVAISCTSR